MANPVFQAARSAEKRAAVLRAAVHLFLDQGYEKTTLLQVSQAAGVSSATTFKHFATKRALFGAVMAAFWDNEDPPPAPAPGDPRAGLGRIGRAYADKLMEPDTAPLFRVIIAEVPRFPELGQELYARGKKPYLDRLEAYLAAETQIGRLRIEDISLASRQFLGMINDVVFWPRELVVDLVVSPQEAVRVVDEAVETMLSRYGVR
jgi:TetR/AcrR family transcriptional regulator, regulator of autoinduction and epiphytic fitness